MVLQHEPQPVSEPRGLPVDELMPAADLMLDVNVPALTGDDGSSEPALDIGSATRGIRMVTASQV